MSVPVVFSALNQKVEGDAFYEREALRKRISMLSSQLAHSPSEAAKILSVCRSTIFNLLARGELSALKIGTRSVITTDELTRYLESLPKAEFHAHTGPRA